MSTANFARSCNARGDVARFTPTANPGTIPVELALHSVGSNLPTIHARFRACQSLPTSKFTFSLTAVAAAIRAPADGLI